MMKDLFEKRGESDSKGVPLAELFRPQNLEEIYGQGHLLDRGTPFRESIEKGEIFSMILWGPPGSGKTTMAGVIAKKTRHAFVPFSAVMGGVKEVREIVAMAETQKRGKGKGTILFVDEIHRFNKIQQDAFLPHVEKGTIILIGATTENPSFALNSPLLSRCRVFVLKPLSVEDIEKILRRILKGIEERSHRKVEIGHEIISAIAKSADGDARRGINLLEMLLKSAVGAFWDESFSIGHEIPDSIRVNVEDVEKLLGKNIFLYDRSGEEHFNTISAFIKSMRGSDPDASIYYMVRMIESGEDPLYILRRMLIFSAEDVGLADPRALEVVISATIAFEKVGLPEGILPMAMAALYLATAPKSNSVIVATNRAKEAVKEKGAVSIPMHLRNPVTALMKELGYGKGYRYPHDEVGHWVPENYLPDELEGEIFYSPSNLGYEKTISERLGKIREYLKKGQ